MPGDAARVPSRTPVVLATLLLGLLLTQAAWVLAVPAFRGIDEFDHVYRAASVARGEWLPSGQAAPHGRGELVSVPRDLVVAAGPECAALRYTGHDNCAPVDDATTGTVQVASAASRYQPAYYWVVGTAARWSHGTSAVEVMRAVSALLCALFVGLAAWTLRRWSTSDWPLLALVGSLTPVVTYSAVVVAPNALEIAAATSVWCAVAGLCSTGLTLRGERTLVWAAVPGAVVLANVRSLGLGFLALIVLVGLGVLGRRRVGGLVRRQLPSVAGAGAVVLGAVAAGLTWLLVAAPNRLEEHGHYPGAVAGSLIQLPVWLLQDVAAAPSRRDPAPGAVYLLCGGVLVALVALALRRASTRVRRAGLLVAVLTLAVPLALTLHTYRDVGVIWQGRYGLPFGVGVLVLAGLALDQARVRLRPAVRIAGLAAFALGQLVEVLHVLDLERRVSPSVAAGLWSAPSPWLVGALTVAGWALVGTALARAYDGRADVVPQERRDVRPAGQAGVLATGPRGVR